MESLKEQYNEILSRENATKSRIDELKDNDALREYFTKVNELKSLQEKRKELYRQIQFEKYSSCDHIWTLTYIDRDECEGRAYPYCGCIKCSLDQRIMLPYNATIAKTIQDGQVMLDFIRENYPQGSDWDLECDLPLAKAIYAKIKAKYPDVDDKTILSYLKTALDDIREIKVSDERKNSRAKRLSLKPGYSKWNMTRWDCMIYRNSDM